MALDRGGEERFEVGGPLARLRPPEVERGPHRALPGAPQAVGVAAAGRALAEAEVAGQGVELVREGHGREDARPTVVAGECTRGLGLRLDRDRVVVPAHRGRHLARRALAREVDPAHDALQLRELADHQGHEVRLGEAGRVPGRRERVPRQEAQPSHGLDQPLHPRRLLAVAAETLVEGHPGQGGDAVGEGALAVLGQEEGGVPQARHDDALHSPHHLGRGGRRRRS